MHSSPAVTAVTTLLKDLKIASISMSDFDRKERLNFVETFITTHLEISPGLWFDGRSGSQSLPEFISKAIKLRNRHI